MIKKVNIVEQTNEMIVEKYKNNVKSIIKVQSFIRKYLQQNKKVLLPCKFNNMINVDNIKKYLKQDYLTSGRIEYYNSTSTKNYILEDGFTEYIVAKSINGKRIGEGNSPIDVINHEKKIGIDVMCLSCNSNQTNEKSIMQNFTGGGNCLDDIFTNKQFQKGINLYKKDYCKKLLKAINKYKIKHLYYLVFISIKNNIYISLFELDITSIINMKFKKNSNKSIYIDNFIDMKYGETKLYKSKKRLELRFNKNIIDNYNTIKLI